MKQVIKEYGGFFIDGMVLVAVIAMVLTGISDSEGNRGMFAMIEARLQVGKTDYGSYTDFGDTFLTESNKEAPRINYSGSNLKAGTIKLSDYLSAIDYQGRPLALRVISIMDSVGIELIDTYNHDTTEISLTLPGIYRITVGAFDDSNRFSECTVAVPVNK